MLPVPIVAVTVPRHLETSVGDTLQTPAAWDRIRQTDAAFAIQPTRDAWRQAAEADPDLPGRADAIARLTRELDAESLCSYAVGAGQLEWLLHLRLPNTNLTCTDFAPATLATLRSHFPEATVVLHDLGVDPPVKADLALLHRVDTEFNDDEWPLVFAGFDRVLVVAADRLRVGQWLRARRRPQGTHVGYMRTRRALTHLWAGSHTHRRIAVGDLQGFLLERR